MFKYYSDIGSDIDTTDNILPRNSFNVLDISKSKEIYKWKPKSNMTTNIKKLITEYERIKLS